MPRLHDEEGKDDWDGQDWSDETTHPRSIRDEGFDHPQTIPNVELDNDGYVLDWKVISDRTRENKDYTCEECKVRLHDQLKLLHVHHINRDKQDNSPQNLRVLCIICHANCEAHEHLANKVLPGERMLIELRRRLQQGIGSSANPKRTTPAPKSIFSAQVQEATRSHPTRRIEADTREKSGKIDIHHHGYRVIARFWKGSFRARAIRYKDKCQIDATGNSQEDAISKLTALIQKDIEEQRNIQRERLPDLHKARIEREGLTYLGVRPRTASTHRVTHCYNCKCGLDNSVDIECIACGWIICTTCAACGCGYAGKADI